MKYASIKYIFDETKNVLNAMELKQKRTLLTLRDLEVFVAFFDSAQHPNQLNEQKNWNQNAHRKNLYGHHD